MTRPENVNVFNLQLISHSLLISEHVTFGDVASNAMNSTSNASLDLFDVASDAKTITANAPN